MGNLRNVLFLILKKDLSHVFEKDRQILSPKGSEEWISDTLEKYLRIGSTNTFESIWSALDVPLFFFPRLVCRTAMPSLFAYVHVRFDTVAG